ncbi:MAG: DUF1990 domain-containing protein, partial [Terracoccus sp.]
ATLSTRRLAELRAASLTYAAVGATRGQLPGGYHHVRRRAAIGAGPTQFRAAAAALMGWQVQRRAGIEVRASAPVIGVDEVADLRIGGGPLRLTAPVRVVHTIENPHSRGFAYGTLPGHPESGEEQFVVELMPSGLVLFTITAFSRPAWRLARLSGPFDDVVQALMTRRYLLALRAPLPTML